MSKQQQEQRLNLQTCFLESLVLKEMTKKPHRLQVTTSLTLIFVQMYFFYHCLDCGFSSNRIAFRSVQSHACSVCFLINQVFTDTILCNFTAIFHVFCRCFIIGRLSVHF